MVKKLFADMWTLGIPLAHGRYRYRADHFIVRDWKRDTIGQYLSDEWGAFYKLFHVTSGKGLIVAGHRNYLLTSGDVAFVKPDEPVSWFTLSGDIEGHFCFVHPRFFNHAHHVLHMFLTFPYALPAQTVVPMNDIQSAGVRQLFESMYRESIGEYEDKRQAILIHLQMILLNVRRAGKGGGRRLNNTRLF